MREEGRGGELEDGPWCEKREAHIDREEAKMRRHDREVERLHRDPGCGAREGEECSRQSMTERSRRGGERDALPQLAWIVGHQLVSILRLASPKPLPSRSDWAVKKRVRTHGVRTNWSTPTRATVAASEGRGERALVGG